MSMSYEKSADKKMKDGLNDDVLGFFGVDRNALRDWSDEDILLAQRLGVKLSNVFGQGISLSSLAAGTFRDHDVRYRCRIRTCSFR